MQSVSTSSTQCWDGNSNETEDIVVGIEFAKGWLCARTRKLCQISQIEGPSSRALPYCNLTRSVWASCRPAVDDLDSYKATLRPTRTRLCKGMDNASARFVLPLPGGNITCTEPASKIYLITFTAPPDNRLTGPFIQAFSLALDIIENRFAKGVVITTSGVPKYYSNGLDFESAMQTPNFLPEVLYPFWIRLLTCAGNLQLLLRAC